MEKKRTVEVNGRTFEMDQIKNILSSRKVIEKPGKYQLAVTQVTNWIEGGKYIVNFKATTEYGIKRAIEALKEEDYQSALNTQMTATVFKDENGNPNGYLPAKGEIVNVIISNHINKEGITILVVSSISEMGLTEAKSAKNTFESFFEVKNDDFAAVKDAMKEVK